MTKFYMRQKMLAENLPDNKNSSEIITLSLWLSKENIMLSFYWPYS